MPGLRVLDIATGTGLSADAALAAAGPTGHVTAADLSPTMAEKARERLGKAPNVSVSVEDGQALSFPGRSFDAVLCNLGLMFFPDPVRASRRFRRVLRVPAGAQPSRSTRWWSARGKIYTRISCLWSFLVSLDQNPYHDVRSWERRISEPGSVTRIISDGDTDVGVLRLIVGASSVPGTDAQLTTLYLLSQARGHGLGSEALAFARAEATLQAGSLGVCVLAGNEAGQRFYERRGAERIGERVAFYLDDQPIMDILYRFGDL